MQIIIDDGENSIKNPAAVAMGNFDGVHKGHQFLLLNMRQIAADSSLTAAVCTFLPHPEKYYGRKVPMISTFEQKLLLLEKEGVEVCFQAVFNSAFAAFTPEYFLEKYIKSRLNAQAVIVGDDFRFGCSRKGDVSMLAGFCSRNGILCKVVPRIEFGNVPISSTTVREVIRAGFLENVPDYMNRYYSCVGVVIKGDRLGTAIGFPTANLELESELVPPAGVYAGFLTIAGVRYNAMIYAGNRPTVDACGAPRFELNVIGLPEGTSLYGMKLEVFIVKKIRDDMKFENLLALKSQLEKDKKTVLGIDPAGR